MNYPIIICVVLSALLGAGCGEPYHIGGGDVGVGVGYRRVISPDEGKGEGYIITGGGFDEGGMGLLANISGTRYDDVMFHRIGFELGMASAKRYLGCSFFYGIGVHTQLSNRGFYGLGWSCTFGLLLHKFRTSGPAIMALASGYGWLGIRDEVFNNGSEASVAGSLVWYF